MSPSFAAQPSSFSSPSSAAPSSSSPQDSDTTSSSQTPLPPPIRPPDPTVDPLAPPFPQSVTGAPDVNSSCKVNAWSSLFKRLPRNAGKYTPTQFDLSFVDDILVPPLEVIHAGSSVWGEYVVGFFLDAPLS